MDLRRLRRQLTSADIAAIDRAMSHLSNNPFPTPTTPPELIKQIGDYWRYLVSPNLRLAYRVINREVRVFKIGLRTDFYNDL
jgi:Txe/YoeB family toxin of Txe-Axe toxin-antitoxin module